jgi:hypothetical protein
MDADGAAAGEEASPVAHAAKRRAYDNVSGKVSGRPWKTAFARHSSLAGRPPADWDAKMREKAAKKEMQARSWPVELCSLLTYRAATRRGAA